MAGCQRSQLHAPAGEEPVWRDEQGIRLLAGEGREGRVDLMAGAGIDDLDLQREVARGLLHLGEGGRHIDRVGWIHQLATRLAAGRSSRKSPNRFAFTSAVKKLRPVALPPGRARLVTRPSFTGSSAAMNAIGIV